MTKPLTQGIYDALNYFANETDNPYDTVLNIGYYYGEGLLTSWDEFPQAQELGQYLDNQGSEQIITTLIQEYDLIKQRKSNNPYYNTEYDYTL